MKKAYIFLLGLILILSGCTTTKLESLKKENSGSRVLEDNLSYSKKAIFDVCLLVIKNKTNLIVRYSDFEKGEIFAQSSYLTTMATSLILGNFAAKTGILGIFLSGDNPTHLRIVQKNSGIYNEDFKYAILQEIKSTLEERFKE